ncbi:Tmh18p ASCRUDRAFT_73786 [Ascoidea rubescens DSM 1968]|uniref:TMEM205-like domain-containing protein n=1 Tax=Ascoidea rubescens DSM 1968 TaxID=1344418 RepID=A0A1D2VR90_9ASCO|nr:hypothetical protein ASCRUDRAFT_73786 [Ascoidea rubescens DSM 1968]ODV64085.1 hypothetical protein ASCRUDRAFT_73786 [Ascoidea rubescens DSM 1968]
MLGIAGTIAPYHVLLYSLMWGSSIFHSYLTAPLVFKALPRKEFGIFAGLILPPYFKAQTVVPILLGLSAPFPISNYAIASLSVASLSGAINSFHLLGWNQSVKTKRNALEVGGKDKDSEGNVSVEMQLLNKEFGKAHGLSLLFNLFSSVALTVYGFQMTSGLINLIPKGI